MLSCKEDLCNFADDNTMSVCDVNLPNVLERIDVEIQVVLTWFKTNGMVANPDKFQATFLGLDLINIKEFLPHIFKHVQISK